MLARANELDVQLEAAKLEANSTKRSLEELDAKHKKLEKEHEITLTSLKLAEDQADEQKRADQFEKKLDSLKY